MPVLLQINVYSNFLSIGKICEDIGKTALKHGWESYVMYGRKAFPSVNKNIRIARMFNTYLHYFEQKIFDDEGCASRFVTKRLIKKITKLNPDIIHLHDIHDHYLNYPILFKFLKESGKPVIWTQHDCWAFTGRCFYFDMVNCERWINGCYKCPLHGVYPNNTLLDSSKSNYLKKRNSFLSVDNFVLVACSNWMASLLKKSFFKEKRIQVIHNGIDLSKFKPSGEKLSSKIFRILGVAAVWDARKGLKDFYTLRERLPIDEYSITLVGLTSSQIDALPNGIKGISRTGSINEMIDLYTHSDVLLNTTYSDNYPTTHMEALACGTPVITYDTGGASESLDENTGIVIKQGDIEALIKAIISIKQIPFSSKNCVERARKCFDKDECFESYIQLYEELLKVDKCIETI